MKVNILGQEYEIKHLSEDEYPKLKVMEANGLAELYSKELIIEKNINPMSGKEFANFDQFKNKVIRHEIVHAFFHEAGITEYTNDERLVDFIALQAPKMLKVFQEAECI